MYDYLIVGAGLYGAVFAREMTDKGYKCLVIDKREHIAGNVYTENIEGINVHKYGAHIFHTSEKKVWDYVNRFAEFNRYTNTPVANYKGEIRRLEVSKYVSDEDFVVEVIERHMEKSKLNIKGAPIIVAGGYGMGSAEGFNMLYDLAAVLGGEVGASRAAVDAGFCEHERQIGQTGVTVRPKLYIACGISGQIQHIAGMQDSSIIIAINNDPHAPINTIADYVITGNVEDVVPKLIKYYKANTK